MSQRVAFRLIAVFVLAMVAAGASGGVTTALQDATPTAGDGLILTRLPLDDEGAFELVAVSAGTGERRSLDVPEPGQIVATPRRDQALVKSMSGDIYLVDAERAVAERLDVPAEIGAELIVSLRSPFVRAGDSDRWAVLIDAQQSLAFLVDLAGGEVADLTSFIPTDDRAVFVAGIDIAPDDAHLVLWSGRELWLFPTDDLASVRRLGDGTYGGDFGPDGSEIVYSRPAGDQTTEVVIETVDGKNQDIVFTADRFVRGAFTPDGDGLVLLESGRVALLDLASGERREVVDLEGEATRTIPGLDGTRFLMGVSGPTDTPLRWHLVDAARGDAQTLDDLGGYEYALDWFATERRWLAFADNRPFDIGGAANVRVVDLRTGDVGDPIPLVPEGKDGAFFEPPADVSADGRYRLIPVDRESGGRMDLLLLDAADGGARPVVRDATRASGAFDPASDRVALSTYNRLADGTAESTISVLDLASGDETPLGPGFGVVWLHP